MSAIGIAIERKDGTRCVSFKIPNSEVPHFQDFASSQQVKAQVTGRRGQEASTVYVCTRENKPEELGHLKDFLKDGIPIFVAEESNKSISESAA